MWGNFSKFLLKKLGKIGAIHYDIGGNELKKKDKRFSLGP